MKIFKLLLLSVIFLMFGTVSPVFAASREEYESNSETTQQVMSEIREGKSVKELYELGVATNSINPASTTYASWQNMEKSFLWPNYLEIKKEGILDKSVDYQQWLKENNFGLVVGNQPQFEMVEKSKPSFSVRSTADNKRNFVNRIKKGDFVVVSGVREPWAPYVGHAAIATTDNYMLDMPGYKDGQYTQTNNNRQLTKGAWFDKYKTAWTTVYRVRTSQSVRANIANWADWRYWSSTHGKNKNRHVKYTLKTTLKGDYGNAYCSKLVWQALYYGSGNLALVRPRPTTFLVAPYFLPSEIIGSYYPNKYGPY